MGGFFDGLPGNARIVQRNIIGNRAGEQEHILQHGRNLRA